METPFKTYPHKSHSNHFLMITPYSQVPALDPVPQRASALEGLPGNVLGVPYVPGTSQGQQCY